MTKREKKRVLNTLEKDRKKIIKNLILTKKQTDKHAQECNRLSLALQILYRLWR